jgi:hypothetical protein
MQNVVNTQITNLAAMQYQTEMFAKQIDQEMEMLCKKVLQSFALSTKAEKTAQGVPERNGKEVQRVISAKDIESQAPFEELAQQVSKLSNARHLHAESIAEAKTRITSHSLTLLPVREKVVEAAPPAPPPSSLTIGSHVRDPPRSPPPENNDEKRRQSPLPRL